MEGRLTPPLHVAQAPLVVEGLTKRFGRVTAVSQLRLVAPAGSVLGLVGPNGSGKTTALRMVLGLIRPDAGSVTVGGHPAGSLAARACATWVPAEPTGFDELTVAEFLALTHALYRADAAAARRATTLLRAFALQDHDERPLRALSHGQRRCVAVVAAASLARPLLVVDEATAALDPDAVMVLREVLRAAAARGSGVVVATQDLHFADTCCDALHLLARGETTVAGTLAELRSAYGVTSAEEIYVAALGRRARLQAVRDDLEAL